MLVPVAIALVLVFSLVARVLRVAAPASWGAPRGDDRAWRLVALATLAAHAPLLKVLPIFLADDAPLLMDAPSHAKMVDVVAKGLATHGWIDAYDGGFPFGPHYPAIGTLLGAALARLGLPPGQAVEVVGHAATIAIPFASIAVARRAGARPLAALFGALAVTWVSPFTFMPASFEVFGHAGMLSQVLGTLVAVLWAGALVAPSARAAPPLLAALLAATHPQIAVAALAVGFVGALAAWRGDAAVRWARSAFAALAVAVAVFGPGVRTMRVPFGWPKMADWLQFGFGGEMLRPWLLDGGLLDVGREPVITLAWVASLVALAVLARRRAPRVALAVSLATLAISVSGGATLQAAGHFAELLLQVLQPVRALALVPIVAAAAIVVAAEEAFALADAALARREGSALAHGFATRALPVALCLVAALFALPVRWDRWVTQVEAFYGALTGDTACGGVPLPGYSTRAVAGWLSSLDRGRLVVDFEDEPHPPLLSCPTIHGLDFASPVPLGPVGGVGAHVGVMASAFVNLRPWQNGSAARAESLGVRWVLRRRLARDSDARAGWKVRAKSAEVVLAERVGGTDGVGVGCVARVWKGSDAALRKALFEDLEGDLTTLADPHVLTALETDDTLAEVERRDAPAEGCDATGASVRERRRESGAYEATVESTAPVDVVVRATAFPTWKLAIDGAEAPVRTIAPGFFAARVPAGRHEVVAVVGVLPHYLEGLAIALAAVVAACRALPARLAKRLGAGEA